MGLSYSNAVKFRSDVIVRYGKPIDLKSYQKEYEADKVSAVQQLTEQIETALSKLTTNVNDLAFEKIVNDLKEAFRFGFEELLKKIKILMLKLMLSPLKEVMQ